MIRDLIGDAPNPSNPWWPNGTRPAINAVLNSKRGSKPPIADGIPRRLDEPIERARLARAAFDCLHRDRTAQPNMAPIGPHMRIIGQPALAGGIGRHARVWIAKRLAIARQRVAHFPANAV